MHPLTEYLVGLEAKMKQVLLLEMISARDERDQEMTAALAYLAQEEGKLARKCGEIALAEQRLGSSAAGAETALKATETYELYIYIKLMREAIVEHLRGLRSHSKRDYQERMIHEGS